MYEFSLVTLCIYVIIGFLSCYWIRESNIRFCHIDKKSVRCRKFDKYVLLFIALLVAIAAARNVTVGTDTKNYELMFNDALNGGELERTELLFVVFTKFVRKLTNNFRIYLSISYFIIGFSYILFIKTYLVKYVSYIPFILVVFPFLNSLNTMRSSLAIAIFLIGISLFKSKKILGFIISLSSVLFHRMMVAFVLLPVFYFLFSKFIAGKNGTTLLLFTVLLALVLSVFVTFLKDIAVRLQLIHNNDFGYLTGENWTGFLGRNYVTLFPYACLLIYLCGCGSRLQNTKEIKMVKVFCIYDIAVIMPALFLGLWRSNEVLYVCRLIMWGALLKSSIKLIDKKYKFIAEIFIFFLFVAWLIFRIISIYESSGLMPYNLWF